MLVHQGFPLLLLKAFHHYAKQVKTDKVETSRVILKEEKWIYVPISTYKIYEETRPGG